MSVVRVPDGSVGFDTDTVIATSATALSKQYKFAIRYLSLSSPQVPGDLSSMELQLILGAGMGLMAVQHTFHPPWTPSGSLGMSTGVAAAVNANSVGLLPGTMIALDWEGLNLNTNPSKAIAYVHNWTTEVRDAGYQAAIYVGYDALFTASQLYNDLIVNLYWKSMSNVPEPAVRGWCMVQSPTVTVGGISIDPDVVWQDNLGDGPMMMVA